MSDAAAVEELRAAYRRQRQADFDHAAAELGGRVLDPLLAGLKRPVLPHPLGSDSFTPWLEERGHEAGLALLAETRRLLGGLEARPPRDELRAANEALTDYANVFSDRVEMPWVVVELLRSGPSAIDLVRYSALRLLAHLQERGRPALRSAVVHRHRFALDLGRYLGRAYDVELAFQTIDVPILRPLAAATLHTHAAALVPRLRELEARTRDDPDLHAVALRLLRAGDKDVMADGRRATTPLEKIEADLRRDPTDAEASQVWADALVGAGDPRGDYVALEHAIRAEKDPARALALSNEQAALLPAVMGKPGGFPFSEAFTGRRTVTLRSNRPVHVPDLRPGNAFDRAQALVTQFGDVLGPTEVYFHEYRDRARPDPSDRAVPPANATEAEFLHLLAPARLVGNRFRRTYVVREDRCSPLADVAALRELVRNTSSLTLVYRFLHTHAGTEIRLPHQERGRLKLSCLQVAPRVREETLYDFHFPFEALGEPALTARWRAMRETYGPFPDQDA